MSNIAAEYAHHLETVSRSSSGDRERSDAYRELGIISGRLCRFDDADDFLMCAEINCPNDPNRLAAILLAKARIAIIRGEAELALDRHAYAAMSLRKAGVNADEVIRANNAFYELRVLAFLGLSRDEEFHAYVRMHDIPSARLRQARQFLVLGAVGAVMSLMKETIANNVFRIRFRAQSESHTLDTIMTRVYDRD